MHELGVNVELGADDVVALDPFTNEPVPIAHIYDSKMNAAFESELSMDGDQPYLDSEGTGAPTAHVAGSNDYASRRILPPMLSKVRVVPFILPNLARKEQESAVIQRNSATNASAEKSERKAEAYRTYAC